MKTVKVVEQPNKENFETEINQLLNDGYHIMSANCDRVNALYQAILIGEKIETPTVQILDRSLLGL
jgi:hypothetical protein